MCNFSAFSVTTASCAAYFVANGIGGGWMKQGKIRRVMVGCHTADGYKSFADENLQGLERVFMLLGGPGCGKSGIIARVADSLSERGLTVELWQVADDVGAPEGVVIPALSAAVVDAGFMEYIHPRNLGVVEEVYNLADCWQTDKLRQNHREITELQARLKANIAEQAGLLGVLAQNQPRRYAGPGVRLSDVELDEIAAGLAQEVFAERHRRVRHLFAAAYTVDGWYSLAQEISATCARRFLLGNGAPQLLARLADEGAARGFSVDMYFDVLRPDSLQMLVFPQLAVAVVDAETPGLLPLFTDELFGRYQQTEGTEKQVGDFAADVAKLQTALLESAGDERRLAAYYTAAMDFDRVEALCAEILAKLWQMAGERGC